MKLNNRWRYASWSAGLFCITWSAQAQAQIDPTLSADNLVLSRPRDGLDPTGFRAGGMTIFPTLDASASYDDNIYETERNRVRSAVLSIDPEVSAVSNWSRHALSLDAAGTFERYTSRSSENNNRYSLKAAGRLDFFRWLHADGSGHYIRSIEARGTLGDVFGAGRPIVFRRRGGDGGITASFAKVRLSASGEYDRTSYQSWRQDGVRVSQAYRDRRYTAGVLNLSFDISPKIRPYIEARREFEHYDNRDRSASFDSTSTVLLGGVDVAITGLLTGHAAAGYRRRDYRNYRTSSGATYDVSLVWNPRTLLTLTVDAQKTIEEAPSFTTSGVIRNAVSAKADYELLRRLLIGASAAGEFEKYRGQDRYDRRFVGSLSARFLLDRYAQIELRYDRVAQDGSGAFGRSYRGNTIGLSLTLQR